MTKDDWNTYFSGHWYFAGARQDGHIAMFPEELPSPPDKNVSLFPARRFWTRSSAVGQLHLPPEI